MPRFGNLAAVLDRAKALALHEVPSGIAVYVEEMEDRDEGILSFRIGDFEVRVPIDPMTYSDEFLREQVRRGLREVQGEGLLGMMEQAKAKAEKYLPLGTEIKVSGLPDRNRGLLEFTVAGKFYMVTLDPATYSDEWLLGEVRRVMGLEPDKKESLGARVYRIAKEALPKNFHVTVDHAPDGKGVNLRFVPHGFTKEVVVRFHPDLTDVDEEGIKKAIDERMWNVVEMEAKKKPYPYDPSSTAREPAQRDPLAHRFTYHPPKPGQPEKYEALRREALVMARLIERYVPDGRERDRAIDRLDEVVMLANAGIARGG